MSFKTTLGLFSSEENFPVNCRISAGGLIPALSPEALRGTVPDGVLYAAKSDGSGYFFVCTDEGVYASLSGGDFLRVASFGGENAFMFEDVADGEARTVIIVGDKAVTCAENKFDAVFSIGANLSCGVMHCGRLFGADADNGFKLRWSGCGGFTDWEQGLHAGGSLVLDAHRGKILGITEYGEKLIAVREYGLTVMSMFGSPENFSVEITDTDTDKIFKGTVRAVAGKLMFCTASGLHSFDGSSVSEVKCGLPKDIYKAASSAEYGGKYFLGFTGEGYEDGAVLCFDTADGKGYFIGVAADALCSADGVYAYNSAGAFVLKTGGSYSYTAKDVNFGTGEYKTVTRVFVDGKADFEISNGRTARKFVGAAGTIRPKLRGRNFTVRLSGDTPVRGVELTAEECDAI